MPARAGLYVVAILVVAGLLLDSLIGGHPPEAVADWLMPIGPSVTIGIAALLIFDRWAWRQPGIRRLTTRPVLHGTWHGEVASRWIDPATGQRIEPDPDTFLVVRQRFWSVSVRLLTNESSSSSLFAELTEGADGVCQLLYIYLNQPRAEVQHRSAPHYGGVVLTAPSNREDGIEGQYFTQRETTGDMRFRVHFPRAVESYSAGQRLLAEESSET